MNWWRWGWPIPTVSRVCAPCCCRRTDVAPLSAWPAGGVALFGMADSGRWSWVRRATPAAREAAIEHVVRTLLKRWGVVCWQLTRVEARWLPPWRELVACLRRLEARGEIRGGRFIAGLSGEQYALPEAVGALREIRRKPVGEQDVSLSAADPLNLTGF